MPAIQVVWCYCGHPGPLRQQTGSYQSSWRGEESAPPQAHLLAIAGEFVSCGHSFEGVEGKGS